MDLISFRKHIIHASYMDMFFGVENTPLYPRNIPDVSTFQINARGSAVNSSDHVVIYENTGRFGYFMGARAWWMFKVSINKRNVTYEGVFPEAFGVGVHSASHNPHPIYNL